VGLDPDMTKIPAELLKTADPIFEFNKQIIDATHELAVAYKLNTAFYEAEGAKGWESLQKTVDYIPEGILKIADAKRGDVDNTSERYAYAFFKTLNFDAVTLSPYMGEDSITPYLKYPGKWVIVLGLTSNKGSKDIQMLKTDNSYVWEDAIRAVKNWGNSDNTMFVIGATHPEMFERVRKIVPDHFLLVPGIGAQGGDFEKVVSSGFNSQCGLLVNASRSIIYAGSGGDYKLKIREAAQLAQREMEHTLKGKKFI